MTRLLLQLARNRYTPSSNQRPSDSRPALCIMMSNTNWIVKQKQRLFWLRPQCIVSEHWHVAVVNNGCRGNFSFRFYFHQLSWNQATVCFLNKWSFYGKMFLGHLCSFYSYDIIIGSFEVATIVTARGSRSEQGRSQRGLTKRGHRNSICWDKRLLSTLKTCL